MSHLNLDCLLHILTSGCRLADIGAVLQTPTRGPLLPPSLIDRIVADVGAGRFPRNGAYSEQPATWYYSYQDALAKYLHNQLVTEELPDSAVRAPTDVVLCALYLHSGYVDGWGGLEVDAAMHMARRLRFVDISQQLAGLLFLESLSRTTASVSVEEVNLKESMLAITHTAIAVLSRYAVAAQARVPNVERYPWVGRFVSDLQMHSEEISTAVTRIAEVFRAWGYDLSRP